MATALSILREGLDRRLPVGRFDWNDGDAKLAEEAQDHLVRPRGMFFEYRGETHHAFEDH